MTPVKRNPTNADILSEIKDLAVEMGAIKNDVTDLKNWRIAVEAAKEALKEFQASQASKVQKEPEQSLSNKALAAVIGVITVLAGVIVVMANQ